MPPAREHAHEAEARPDLPDPAATLAELLVGDGLELVLARREQHALEANSVLLLLAAASLELEAGVTQAGGERVAQRLELAEGEHPRTATERRGSS